MPRRTMVRRSTEPFLLALRLLRDEVPSFDVYPFQLPFLRTLHELPPDAQVTFLVGEGAPTRSTVASPRTNSRTENRSSRW